jgi:hypothetical protein
MPEQKKKSFRLRKSNKVCPECKNTLIMKTVDVLVCNNIFCKTVVVNSKTGTIMFMVSE